MKYNKIGFLRNNRRYEYCEVLSIEGDNITLVRRHPRNYKWDNYFTESMERVCKFAHTPSKDYANKMLTKLK